MDYSTKRKKERWVKKKGSRMGYNREKKDEENQGRNCSLCTKEKLEIVEFKNVKELIN